MTEPTTEKLARALEAIPGMPAEMAEQARAGRYHNFLSPLPLPEMQLAADLRALSRADVTPVASRALLRDLAEQVIAGEFAASKKEAETWAASPEGQEAIRLTAP